MLDRGRATGPVFRILGPVGVGAMETLRSGQQRTLLAALVLPGNRTVSNDRLIEVLHGDDPPPSAGHGLHVRVSQLRRTLGAALEGADDRLVLSPPGYRLRVLPGELDWDVFRALADHGRQALSAGQVTEAGEALAAALALWRGAPFADVTSPALDDQRAHLEQRRLAACEDRFEAGLRAGRHVELAGELAEAVDGQPLRERLRGQLMLALYRCGRVTEALAAYRDGRKLLSDGYGLEPGEELRRLEAAILRADPVLELPAEPVTVVQRTAAPSAAGVVPAQLPADVEHFTGRTADLDRLDAWSRPRSGGSPAMVLTAIAGTAGVGKTALAVHWAQRAKGDFPDGQLYADLRGYDPDQPVTAGDALALFLRELGVDDVPLDVQQRAARYRSLLAGRRMLILLDNASSVEQVRPLLPGSGSCAVLVTSRDDLAGLVARHGAQRVTLDLLPAGDALRLLAVLVGDRVADEPVAAAELVRRCARLPLAVRIAAERAVARPDLSITDLLAELADEAERLDVLGAGGDERTAVRAVFSWSYRHLAEPDARAFRLLGLHPGRDTDSWALAAMTGGSVREAADRLARLARAHLVRRAGERCSMHDLLRAYASEQAQAQGEQDLALRLLDYYAAAAEQAAVQLHPDGEQFQPATVAVAVSLPDFAGGDAARRWLDAERANLVSAAELAERRRPEAALRLATATWRHLDAGGRGVEALAMQGHAVVAARRAGDAAAEGRALTYLGVVYWRAGRFEDAAQHYTDALDRLGRAGDELMAARTRMNLGMLREAQGRGQEAGELWEAALTVFRAHGYRIGHIDALRNLADLDVAGGRLPAAHERYSEALRICAALDDPMREGMARNNFSEVLKQLGRRDEALEQLLSALDLFRRSGFRVGEAHALHSLGELYLQLGRPAQAAGFLVESLAVFREIGYPDGELDALLTLAAVRQAEGDVAGALELYRQALPKVQDAGMVMLEVRARNGMAEALAACGAHEQAADHHERALELAVTADQLGQQARAHDGLGQARYGQSRTGEAREHWLTALAIYRDMGLPEADAVAERLAGLDEPVAGNL